MTRRIFATLILTTTALASCAKNENGGAQGDQRPQAAILGNWKSNCIEGQNLALVSKTALGITQRSELSVDETTIKETAMITSSACDGIDIQISSSGDFAVEPAKDQNVRAFRASMNSYRVTPVTEFGMRVLNLSKWCGLSDWQIGQEREVTSRIGQENCFKSRNIGALFAPENGNVYFHMTDKLESSANSPLQNKSFYFTRL